METHDEDLILAHQQGDETALGQLFERHKKTVFNFSLRILANRADAEDVTAEVFLKLSAQPGSYQQSTAKFSTWLLAVARNTCITKLRSKKGMFSLWHRTDESGEYVEWDIPDTKALPDDEIMMRETARLVRRAIAKLPDMQKEAIVLREYHQLSYEEISKVLNCSLEQVKVLIFRARERLRSEIPSVLSGG